MRRLGAITSCTIAFAGAFFGRRDPSTQCDSNGLTTLKGWPRLPEQAALDALSEPPHTNKVRAVLYCHRGMHAGEVFPLRGRSAQIGTSADADIVLTPSQDALPTSYRIDLSDGVWITAKAPHAFELNGRTEYRANLVDFDEVSLLGNQFILLELDPTALGENP